jgi:hypothetical protein
MSAESHRLKGSTSELAYSTVHRVAMADLIMFAYMSISFLDLCRHFESELKYYCTIRDGNISPTSTFPSNLFPSGFLTKPLYARLLSVVHAKCPVQLILLHLVTRIIFGGFFNRCTVHLDTVKIPFYQQMHLLLNI